MRLQYFGTHPLFDLSLCSFYFYRDEGLSHGVKVQVALKIVLQVVEQKYFEQRYKRKQKYTLKDDNLKAVLSKSLLVVPNLRYGSCRIFLKLPYNRMKIYAYILSRDRDYRRVSIGN
jgi:hypothetical protein